MPNNWLHNIQNHQETPPEGVWKNIASKLNSIDATAPLTVGEKLRVYEVVPPEIVLNNIFAKLNTATPETRPSFIKRVYEYSVAAPVNAWDNIKARLEKPAAAIVPIKAAKNTNKIFYIRMTAAAAAITGVIMLTVFLVKEKSVSVTENVATVETKKQSGNTANAGNTGVVPVTIDAKKAAVKEPVASHPVNKVKKQSEQELLPNYTTGSTVNDLAENPSAANKEKLQDASGNTPMDIGLMNTPNTYLSITGPDGQSVKVSSKFSNLLSYLTDKNEGTLENLDIIISESAKWRSTFAAWRDKMTNNAVAPTPFNFMDIIELSKVLEAKQ